MRQLPSIRRRRLRRKAIAAAALTCAIFVCYESGAAQNVLPWQYFSSYAQLLSDAIMLGNVTANTTGKLAHFFNVTVDGTLNATPSGCANLSGAVTSSGCVTSYGSQAANTLLGNPGSTAASPSALAVGGCSGSMRWVTSTGFACNSGGQLPGTATNDNASAGNVGEYITSTVPIGAAVSLTSAVAKTMTSVSLTAGDWECVANEDITNTGTASYVYGSISTTNNTQAAAGSENNSILIFSAVPSTASMYISIGPTRLSLASTTTIYAIAQEGFVTTGAAYGFLGCRRFR